MRGAGMVLEWAMGMIQLSPQSVCRVLPHAHSETFLLVMHVVVLS